MLLEEEEEEEEAALISTRRTDRDSPSKEDGTTLSEFKYAIVRWEEPPSSACVDWILQSNDTLYKTSEEEEL
jgi:hypothetical protein